MKTLKLLITILGFFTCLIPGRAAHLVGGEITYRCLGNNNYEITLLIYRDCLSNGASLDSWAAISIYDQNNLLISNDSVSLLSISSLPLIAPDNCTSLPKTVCTEKGIYKYVKNLPPKAGGYTITHQRCCRNQTITNINNTSSQWGSTYTTVIPSNDVGCNSSPKFNDDPPVVLCQNKDVALDLSATDIDGDSLHYELCSALHGGANAPASMIAPNPAAPPPYQDVPFLPGYTTQQPITSFPQFTINPLTGILNGTPTQVGQFVFAICVSEYRNGALLSTTRRDFQFNVSNACRAIIARIEDQSLNPKNLCSGGKIFFQNKSQFASSYFWDFGDSTTTADTSRQANPVYSYRDTGTYNVMLIADPGTSCADTTFSPFKIYDSIAVQFTYKGEKCFDSHSLDFTPSGNFSPQASFTWDFGGMTSLGNSSSLQFPKNVSWASPGTYFVTVTVDDFGCESTYGDSVDIYINPEIDEDVPPTQACLPHNVQFTDQTNAMGPVKHLWKFGDGNTSTEINPSHTYTAPGSYTVEHSIKTLRGCLDSGYSVYPQVIEIFPVPKGALEWDSREKSIYDPVFHVINRSEGSSHTQSIFPDGQELQNFTEATIELNDTGNFKVLHLSYNEFGCVDTLIDTIRVDDPFTLFIPSAFTPDGDGINDVFFFRMSGVAAIEFEIYNRWGERVYSSTNPYEGWNGRHENVGEILPSGVYSYILIATVREGATEHVETGTVTLLR